MNDRVLFRGVRDGKTFMVAGMEFIKFPDRDGKTAVAAKNVMFYSAFGSNNDLRKSPVFVRLKEKVLPKIIEAVGEENVLSFETDLTAWDGLKDYGTLESKISLPTMDFYRANVEIFDQRKSDWWWLATPETTATHGNDRWVLCVSPSGILSGDRCSNGSYGVRPFCIFKSSIFGSFEE